MWTMLFKSKLIFLGTFKNIWFTKSPLMNENSKMDLFIGKARSYLTSEEEVVFFCQNITLTLTSNLLTIQFFLPNT